MNSEKLIIAKSSNDKTSRFMAQGPDLKNVIQNNTIPLLIK